MNPKCFRCNVEMVWSNDMKGYVCPRCGLFEIENTFEVENNA